MFYKYYPPQRLDVLENCRIRFSPPMDFNDPFELLPGLSLFLTSGLRTIMEAEAREEMQFSIALKAAKQGKKVHWDEPNFERLFERMFAASEKEISGKAVDRKSTRLNSSH